MVTTITLPGAKLRIDSDEEGVRMSITYAGDALVEFDLTPGKAEEIAGNLGAAARASRARKGALARAAKRTR